MRRTLNQDRRVVMNAMIENYNLTVIGSKEKTLFFADATGKGDLVEVPVDVKTMTSRQLLDAALDFTK